MNSPPRMGEPEDLGRLMTITEVADYCRVHPRTVRRWMRRGAIRFRRVCVFSGAVRFMKRDVLVAMDRMFDEQGGMKSRVDAANPRPN